MKIKNILIASSIAFALFFPVSYGIANARPDKLITFEEFVQDKEQFEKWEKDHIEHIKAIQELKDEKRVRTMEYKAFIHNPNAEPSDISKAAREIVKLDRQIDDLNQEFVNNTREKYGLDMPIFGGQRGFGSYIPEYCFAPKDCPFRGGLDKSAPHHGKRMPPHFGTVDKPIPPHHNVKPPLHDEFTKDKPMKKQAPTPVEKEEIQK